jgi:hypothetical protein
LNRAHEISSVHVPDVGEISALVSPEYVVVPIAVKVAGADHVEIGVPGGDRLFADNGIGGHQPDDVLSRGIVAPQQIGIQIPIKISAGDDLPV